MHDLHAHVMCGTNIFQVILTVLSLPAFSCLLEYQIREGIEIMSLYEIPMTLSAPDRVYHLAHDLRYTDPRPQVGYAVALQELKSIIRSAGLSYAVLRTNISSQEFRRAFKVLIGQAHLVGESELCSNQSKLEHNTRQNEQIYTIVGQDKQSTINGSEEGEEDVEALATKLFPTKRKIFKTPSESLMYYGEQLSDQPGWKAYMASTGEPPQSSWKGVYSHLIGYLLSIEATYNKLLIEGIARLFEPKKTFKIGNLRDFSSS